MNTHKTTRHQAEPKRSDPTIDVQGLEAFRATLPDYRQYEVYRFLTTEWYIVRALYLVHKYPREPYVIDVALFARNYGFTFIESGQSSEGIPLGSDYFYVDTTSVMHDQVDLTRPLLIALLAEPGREKPYATLIDGLHRLCKAARLGTVQLPAYVLTPEEEQLCRL